MACTGVPLLDLPVNAPDGKRFPACLHGIDQVLYDGNCGAGDGGGATAGGGFDEHFRDSGVPDPDLDRYWDDGRPAAQRLGCGDVEDSASLR
jgi:hypothetical protein